MASSSKGSLSNDEIKDRIQNILSKFVVGVEPDRLSDWLVQENVITSDQWQRIHTAHLTEQRRCRALLHHLFSIPHPRAFEVVYQALTEESHYILVLIDNQEPISGTGSHPDKRIISHIPSNICDINRKGQLEKDFSDQKKAWEAEKDCFLKTQDEYKAKLQQLEKDYEDQKSAWEADRDRLLKTQKELETKLSVAELRYKSDPVLIQTIRTNSDKKKKSRLRAAKESKDVRGMTILDKELFVVNDKSSKIDVYDLMDFSLSRRWNLKKLIAATDIASCDRNKCLYIFNYKGLDQPNDILRVDLLGKLINNWSTGDDWGHGLSVTAESTVILAVFNESKLNEYSPDGHLIRNVNLSSDLCTHKITHAIKLTSGHFLVCQICISRDEEDDDLCRVCIVDEEGKLKKSLSGKRGSFIEQMYCPIHLSVDANGFVMVADRDNSRVVLLDSALQFKEVILSRDRHALRFPNRILLDESNRRLLVADNEPENRRILIFHYD